MTRSHPPKPISGTIYLVAAGVGLLGLICGGGPLAWWIVRNNAAARQLEQEVGALIESGLPVDDASLEAYRLRHMSTEYSERWMRVLNLLQSDEFNRTVGGVPVVSPMETEFDPDQPWKHRKTVKQFLEDWSDILAEIHDITEGSGPIWTEIQFDSFNTVLPHIQTTRQVSRLLRLEHLLATDQQDADRAYGAIRALSGTARSLEQEPLVVAQLIRHALQSGSPYLRVSKGKLPYPRKASHF